MGEQDLEALFLAHRWELELYLTRQVRCHDTAADLLQDTFLRLRQQPADASLTNIRAYLYRTARNLAIDHFRREKRRRTDATPTDQLAGIADSAVPADRLIEARQRLDALHRAVAELPDRTRRVFELNRLEGLTHREVAQCLGISESSVQKHLARALLHAMRRLSSP